ncbi:hypothetical protein CBR_g12433 [Chara braunii]|uniref:Uncharacterized protein n=1 Tax=Chara braunii TaxID=69332 RepID=A0A388JSG6_CHABU|nr:hypothetical protein CBR_g12433 [Chara braunii]|eukprot:GBG60697.1 hypothetical protein CBR_g12433 [Chara braunii]
MAEQGLAEIEVVSADTPWCADCRRFYHYVGNPDCPTNSRHKDQRKQKGKSGHEKSKDNAEKNPKGKEKEKGKERGRKEKDKGSREKDGRKSSDRDKEKEREKESHYPTTGRELVVWKERSKFTYQEVLKGTETHQKETNEREVEKEKEREQKETELKEDGKNKQEDEDMEEKGIKEEDLGDMEEKNGVNHEEEEEKQEERTEGEIEEEEEEDEKEEEEEEDEEDEEEEEEEEEEDNELQKEREKEEDKGNPRREEGKDKAENLDETPGEEFPVSRIGKAKNEDGLEKVNKEFPTEEIRGNPNSEDMGTTKKTVGDLLEEGEEQGDEQTEEDLVEEEGRNNSKSEGEVDILGIVRETLQGRITEDNSWNSPQDLLTQYDAARALTHGSLSGKAKLYYNDMYESDRKKEGRPDQEEGGLTEEVQKESTKEWSFIDTEPPTVPGKTRCSILKEVNHKINRIVIPGGSPSKRAQMNDATGVSTTEEESIEISPERIQKSVGVGQKRSYLHQVARREISLSRPMKTFSEQDRLKGAVEKYLVPLICSDVSSNDTLVLTRLTNNEVAEIPAIPVKDTPTDEEIVELTKRS